MLGVSLSVLSACSQPEKLDKGTEQLSDLPQAYNNDTLQQSLPEPTPLLTLDELLSADDVKMGLAEAARTNDTEALKEWQSRLLAAGEEVMLPERQMQALSGDQGLTFLTFQGMKTNYQADFERAFFEFGDIEAVFAKYPAFETLQKQSRDLVQKRDQLINSAAKTLEDEGLSEEEALHEARAQWQSVMASQIVK